MFPQVACCFPSKMKCSVLTKCLSDDQRHRTPAASHERWFPVSGGNDRLSALPPLSPRPACYLWGLENTIKTGPFCSEVVEEYSCDKFTGSLEDPLIFWEMTRRLWPRCVKFPLLYPSYMPWTIYLESEGIFTIQATSQAIKEIYSE